MLRIDKVNKQRNCFCHSLCLLFLSKFIFNAANKVNIDKPKNIIAVYGFSYIFKNLNAKIKNIKATINKNAFITYKLIRYRL